MHIPVHPRTIALTGSHRLISSKISLGCGASARRTGKHLGQRRAEDGSTRIHKTNMTPHINIHTKANELMTSISYKKMHDISHWYSFFFLGQPNSVFLCFVILVEILGVCDCHPPTRTSSQSSPMCRHLQSIHWADILWLFQSQLPITRQNFFSEATSTFHWKDNYSDFQEYEVSRIFPRNNLWLASHFDWG